MPGKRILVVESDHRVGAALCTALRQQGYLPIGPAPTPFYALQSLTRRGVDGAIIATRPHGIPVYDLADELVRRGTPMLLVLSGASETVPPRFRDYLRFTRPFDQDAILVALAGLLSAPPTQAPLRGPGVQRSGNDHDRLIRALTAAIRPQVWNAGQTRQT